jgi:16S rRNA (guanine527-N7)-methyltransferase
LTGVREFGSYFGTVLGSNLQECLESHAVAIGLHDLPWEKLEGLGRQWLRFGRAMNLSGARDYPTLAEQVAEGLEVVALAGRLGCVRGHRWVDIGSGAGFPGLVVAACLPVEVVMVEPRERRASFLELMLGELGAVGRVVRGRLEPTGVQEGRRILGERFEWASARAVFSPMEWVRRSPVLLAQGGITVVHLHAGDPDPSGHVALAAVDGGKWSVRGYRCST